MTNKGGTRKRSPFNFLGSDFFHFSHASFELRDYLCLSVDTTMKTIDFACQFFFSICKIFLRYHPLFYVMKPLLNLFKSLGYGGS